MRKIHFLLLLAAAASCMAQPVWAGTQVKAHLENKSYPEAWVDVEVSIEKGRLRLDFRGPQSRGSLIYVQSASWVMVVDDLHKTVMSISPETQGTLKMIGALGSAKMESEIAASGGKAREILDLVRESAKAFFNGVPALKERAVPKAGFSCDCYRTDLGKKKAREVWMAPTKMTGIALEDYGTFLGLANLALDLCGSELFQLGAESDILRRRFTQSRLPVLSVLYVGGKPSSFFQILSVHSQAFRPGVFDPPSGYQTLSLIDLIKKGI